MSDYVHFGLVYFTPENSSLPYLPPTRTCVDTDPWMTAVKASVFANQNEDAGCEGRFNSGFAISAGFSNLVALAGIRVPWKGVAFVVVFALISTSALAFSVAAHDFSLVRQMVLLVCTGTVTALMCEARRLHAKQYSETMQASVILAQRSSDLLNTFIPQEVIKAAKHVATTKFAIDELETEGCVKGADAGNDNKNINTTNKNSSSRVDSNSAGRRGERAAGKRVLEESQSGLVNSNICMELEKSLDEVVMMFCSLPSSQLMGTNKEVFTLLNNIFVEFDKQVSKAGMFKYHHYNNTFVVASPAAALRTDVFLSRRDEVVAMLTLASRLKAIARDFKTPQGQRLSLGVGVDVGPMLGRIVGGYRSYWCLFGNAINFSARLSSLSHKPEWRTSAGV